jgi:hypothetical protein
MSRLPVAVLAVLLPLPAAAAGDEPPPLVSLISLYLIIGYLVLAFGYGFSAMRALPATVGALAFALILSASIWSSYGLQKAIAAVVVVGTLVLLFTPMLGLGVYLGRRAARHAVARKVLSTNGN